MPCFVALIASANAGPRIILPQPHVLALDRAVLANAIRGVDKNAIDTAIRAIIPDLMSKYDANLLLERSAVLAGGGTVDITAEVFGLLQKKLPDVHMIPLKSSDVVDPVAVLAPRLLVIDKKQIALRNPAINTDPDSDVMRPVLTDIMHEREANMILDRDAIIYGTDGSFDVTQRVVWQLGLSPLDGKREDAANVNYSPVPPPVIAVIDRAGLLRSSSVGRDLQRQVSALTAQAGRKPGENELGVEGAADPLEQAPGEPASGPVAAAERNSANLTPQNEIERRRNQIQASVYRARKRIDAVLAPIVIEIMKESGANLLIDRGAVIYGTTGDFDVTTITVERLDLSLPSVKLDVADAPPIP